MVIAVAGWRRSAVPVDDPAVLRHAALDLLARREHSFRELETKLGQRFGAGAPVTAVVSRLRDEGLQSDERFAEALVRAQQRRGYGPLRIRQELLERGVAREVASSCLDDASEEWAETARRWRVRRHGHESIAGAEERARISRQLQRRGFTAAQIRFALD